MFKKFLPKILIILIATMVVFGPLVINTAMAVDPSVPAPDPQKKEETTVMSMITGFAWDAIKNIIASVINVILWIVARILWAIQIVFDKSIELSLNTGGLMGIAAVKAGWVVSRDVANLFFIFILLYIAIATILQISGYGMKELLTKLIVIALLVNFSFIITQTIIASSNSLATGFYENAKREGGGDITKGLIKGLKLHTIWNEKEVKAGEPAAVNAGITGSPDLYNIIMVGVFGIILILVLSFVLLAATVLFLVRSVALLFLLVLSPLAYLAMVLPATRKYSGEWWNKLFSQAFFAPVFMFFIYLTIIIINDDGFTAMINVGTGDIGNCSTGSDSSACGVLVNFLVVIGLLIGSLISALRLGAIGSATVVGWGQSARKWGQGYAGSFAGRNTVGKISRGLAESETFKTFAAKSPRVGGATLRTLQRGAKVGGLDKQTETRVATAMGLSPQGRAEAFGKLDKASQKEMYKKLSAEERIMLGEKAKPEHRAEIRRFEGELSAKAALGRGFLSTKEMEETQKARAEIQKKANIKGLGSASLADAQTIIKTIKPAEIENIGDDVFDDKDKLEAMVNSFGAGHAKKILDRGEKAEKQFYTHLASLGDGVEEIAQKLQSVGNTSLAAYVKSGPATKSLLESYGMKKRGASKVYGEDMV